MPLSLACQAELTEIEHHFGERTSLCPSRSQTTSLLQIGMELFDEIDDQPLEVAFTDGIRQIANAQKRHFPENIFGDFDFLASSVLYAHQHDPHQRTRRTPQEITHLCKRIAGLQGIFGVFSPIRFRYVHDFVYGSDWARWVKKNPEQHAIIGPFDLEFIAYLEVRAGELRELIAQDDNKYPTLRDARHRNPFSFSRDPNDERRLHEALATRDQIPVHAWAIQGPARWDRPFSQIRKERAKSLGIAEN